jgi:hypothetical protein
VFDQLALFARTARYLTPGQWLYYPLRKLQRATAAKNAKALSLDLENLPLLTEAAAVLRGRPFPGAHQRAENIVSHRFEFLNHTEELTTVDWTRDYVSPLWTYNLQYFDFVTDLTQAFLETNDRRFLEWIEALVVEWIQSTSNGKGRAWDPYPTSIRVVNWIFALLLLKDRLRADVKALMMQSLSRQLSHLERRLERHLLGNHLQKNLVALFLGGLFFQGATPARWRSNGARLLWREIDRQILPDGMHAERSPMYHAIALQDLLEIVLLARRGGEKVPLAVLQRLRLMADATRYITRGKDGLHLINDSALGIAPSTSHLEGLANEILGVGSSFHGGAWALSASGFYGLVDNAARDKLIIDCGDPGPSYQPGHAHCGILSYELDIAGTQVVVDSGLHGYDADTFREYVRSTRAHNTVTVNGREQSEMWGTFRLGRRARALATAQRGDTTQYVFEGSYRPYHDAGSIHTRTLTRSRSVLEVTDLVRGGGQHLESFVHFHPSMSIDRVGNSLHASCGKVVLRIETFGIDGMSVHRGELNPVQAWYCPEFGKALPQTVIAMRVDKNAGRPFGYRILVVSRE